MFIGGCAKDAAVVEEPTATPVAVEVESITIIFLIELLLSYDIDFA